MAYFFFLLFLISLFSKKEKLHFRNNNNNNITINNIKRRWEKDKIQNYLIKKDSTRIEATNQSTKIKRELQLINLKFDR